MNLYSYVVRFDFGFAPNPFHGHCTLATCKPKIRSAAKIGDWVVGTGAKDKYKRTGRLIYAMKVDEKLSFDDYWNDRRFTAKRPVLNGSLKQMYGDNIYHRAGDEWLQANSHHSLEDGSPNHEHVKRDTGTNWVLIAKRFVYFGSSAILIPEHLKSFGPDDEKLCARRGHRRVSRELATAFEEWIEGLGLWNVQAMPLEFERQERQQRRIRLSGVAPKERALLRTS